MIYRHIKIWKLPNWSLEPEPSAICCSPKSAADHKEESYLEFVIKTKSKLR